MPRLSVFYRDPLGVFDSDHLWVTRQAYETPRRRTLCDMVCWWWLAWKSPICTCLEPLEDGGLIVLCCHRGNQWYLVVSKIICVAASICTMQPQLGYTGGVGKICPRGDGEVLMTWVLEVWLSCCALHHRTCAVTDDASTSWKLSSNVEGLTWGRRVETPSSCLRLNKIMTELILRLHKRGWCSPVLYSLVKPRTLYVSPSNAAHEWWVGTMCSVSCVQCTARLHRACREIETAFLVAHVEELMKPNNVYNNSDSPYPNGSRSAGCRYLSNVWEGVSSSMLATWWDSTALSLTNQGEQSESHVMRLGCSW